MNVQSLNEGFDLDTIQTNPGHALDVALFKPETMVMGQVPQLRDDAEIDTLVGQWDDLEYLRNDIIGARGMSRSFAMEAHSIFPEFLNNNRPIEFFTDLPTKTQYVVSLEVIEGQQKSIGARIWATIKEWWKKLMSLFQKKKEWFDTYFPENEEKLQLIAKRPDEINVIVSLYESLCLEPEQTAEWFLKKINKLEGEQYAKLKEEIITTFKDKLSVHKYANQPSSWVLMALYLDQELWREFQKYTLEVEKMAEQLPAVINALQGDSSVNIGEQLDYRGLEDFVAKMKGLQGDHLHATDHEFEPIDAVRRMLPFYEAIAKTSTKRSLKNYDLDHILRDFEKDNTNAVADRQLTQGLRGMLGFMFKAQQYEQQFLQTFLPLVDRINAAAHYIYHLDVKLIKVAESTKSDVSGFKDAIGFAETKKWFDAFNGYKH